MPDHAAGEGNVDLLLLGPALPLHEAVPGDHAEARLPEDAVLGVHGIALGYDMRSAVVDVGADELAGAHQYADEASEVGDSYRDVGIDGGDDVAVVEEHHCAASAEAV